MATGIGGEVLWICPTLSSTNDIDDLSGNISTPSTHSGANVISETGNGGTHSISFNGTQGIDLGSSTIHSGSTFSYSCWFKTTQAISTGGGAGLIGQYIIHNDRGPSLVLHGGRAQLYYQSNGGTYNANEVTSDPSASNDGNWHHVAAVFEGSSGTAKVYVDGSLVATGSNVPSSVNQTRNLYLGDSNGGLLSGSMDDVRAFDRVLADQEIVSLSQRRGYEPTNGIGDERLWLCPSIDDSADDISGNGHHGTYNGGMGTVADTSEGGSRAYSIDGVDDYLSCGDILDNIFTGGIFSISSWLYAPTNDAWILTKAHTIDGRQFYFAVRDYSGTSYLTFVIYTSSGNFRWYRGSTPISNSSWYHTTALFDNSLPDTSNVKLWLDGTEETMVLVQQVGTWTNFSNSGTELGIGGFIGSSLQIPFSSVNDDIRVFDRALTASEITSLASTRGYTSGGGGGGGEGEGGNLDFHPFNSTHVLD